MSPKTLLAASALASLLASPLAAQDAPDRARLFDLRSVFGADAPAPASVDLRLPVSASDINAVYFDPRVLLADGRPFGVRIDDGFALVRAAIDAAASADAERIETLPGRILVVGNEAAHDAAERAVHTLQAALAPRVAVEVLRVPRGAVRGASSSVLDTARTEALFEEHTSAPRAATTATFGRTELVGTSSWTAHVHDFDVEVAQGAFAADPTITRLPTGRTLGLFIDPAAAGGFLVRAWGRSSAPSGPVRTVTVPGLGGNTIDLPKVATSSFTTSAKVPDGGALCVDLDGGEVLVIRTRDMLEEADDGALRLGALAGPALAIPPTQLSVIQPSRGLDMPQDRVLGSDTESRWFNCGISGIDFIDQLLDRRDVSVEAVVLGTQALGVWSAEDRTELQTRAAELEASVSTASFAFAFDAVMDAEVGGLLSDPARLEAFVDRADGRMSGAALDGDTLELLTGTERAYVQDYDIQIAAGAVIPDPIVKAVFDGVRIWCAPLGREGDRFRVLLDVQAQESRFGSDLRTVKSYVPGTHDGDEGRALATGAFDAELPVELGALRVQRTRTLESLEPGVWKVVTAQPVESTGTTFVVAMRCTLDTE